MAKDKGQGGVKKLSAKQEKFCQHYAVFGNATQAAIEAGYSQRSARAMGSENLTKPDIKARIAEILSPALEELGVSRDYLHSRWYAAVSLDLASVYSRIKFTKKAPPDLSDLTDQERSCVTAIKRVQGAWVVEFIAKETALKELSRLLKLVKEGNETNIFVGDIPGKSISDDGHVIDDERIITSEDEMIKKYG